MKRGPGCFKIVDGRLDLGPFVMGIVNATPDSFSDGGVHVGAELAHARKLFADGAWIVDIGGESTRPGAAPLPVAEELNRVIPLVRALAAELPVRDAPEPIGKRISIDTYKSTVADEALRAGATIVNDISGGLLDPRLLEVAAAHEAYVVLGHIRGTPATMRDHAKYTDVVAEVRDELALRIAAAKQAGVADDHIFIDPGLGFAKNPDHNLALLANLDALRVLGCPIVLGASRKGFLSAMANPVDGVPVTEREPLTAAAHAIALWLGAVDIIRVHDVAAHDPVMVFMVRASEARRRE